MSRWFCFCPPANTAHLSLDHRRHLADELAQHVVLDRDDPIDLVKQDIDRLQAFGGVAGPDVGHEHHRDLGRYGGVVLHRSLHGAGRPPHRRLHHQHVDADLPAVARELHGLARPPASVGGDGESPIAGVLGDCPRHVGDLVVGHESEEAVAVGEQRGVAPAVQVSVYEPAEARVVDLPVACEWRLQRRDRARQSLADFFTVDHLSAPSSDCVHCWARWIIACPPRWKMFRECYTAGCPTNAYRRERADGPGA